MFDRASRDSKYPHLRPIVERLSAAHVTPPPAPWRVGSVHAVGGLRAVGFADDCDLLLVPSSAGLGVIDCAADRRVARDADADFTFEDELQLRCRGIGPLAGRVVAMAGLHGGGLRAMTADGWQIERLTLAWPEEMLLLLPPESDLYETRAGRRADFVKLYEDAGLRAAGFSPTGRTIVIATASEVALFSRQPSVAS